MADRTADEEQRTKGPDGKSRYARITRTQYVALESGDNAAGTERMRGVLSAVFGLTRDALADYLDGVATLDETLAERDRLRAGRAAARSQAGVPSYATHPNWERLCDEAREIDPELRDATFEALSTSPFPFGDVEKMDKHLLVAIAGGVQKWLLRSGTSRS